MSCNIDKPEMTIKAEIRKALGKNPQVKLFNNPCGIGFQGQPMNSANDSRDRIIRLKDYRRIEFGLIKGSSDLIGWRQLTITPDMVGMHVAQFVAIEVKDATGRLQPSQGVFIGQVNGAGGLAGIARSAEDALELMRSGLKNYEV